MGFLREAVIAYVFGVGAVTDAYAVAVRVAATAVLPTSVYLTKVFIPSYVRTKERQGEAAALRLANNALNIALALNILLMFILQAGAPLILRLTGFDETQHTFALTAISIVALKLPVLAFISLFTGYLAARKSFIGPNLIGIPMNIVVIALCLVFGTESGVAGLSSAWIIGTAAQLFVLILWLPSQRYRYRFSMRVTKELRADMRLLGPALLASAMVDINNWVGTIIATHLAVGSAAAMNFALRLIALVHGLVVVPAANVVYSYNSEYAAKSDTSKMLGILWQTMRVIMFIVLPVIVIAIPSGFDIVRIVFERGQFTPEDTVMTGTILTWLLPMLLGMAVYTLLVQFFYVLQDTKTPMYAGIFSIIANIALSLWLSRLLGIGGLAFASSVSGIITSALLLILLRRKIGPMGFRKIAKEFIKMTLCAVPCAIAALAARYFTQYAHPIMRFGASTVAGGGAYLLASYLLKVTVLNDFFGILRARFGK